MTIAVGSNELEQAGIRVVFTRRAGGLSAAPYDSLNLGLHVGDEAATVLSNRARLADTLGVARDRITYMQQVHGAGVSVVTAADIGRGNACQEDAIADCDALVTAQSQVGLAVLAADCVPILMADPDVGVIAAVHAGWRGATAGVASAALTAMQELGARPERVWVALGPAIRGCCYEVDTPVIKAVETAYKRFAPDRRPPLGRGVNRWRAQLDLPALCADELAAAGVRERHVIDVAICTSCMQGHFSHRAGHGRAGRHAGVIWRQERRPLRRG